MAKITATQTSRPQNSSAVPIRSDSNRDLPALAFLALRMTFFDEAGNPITFELRHKRNTQDDPFDEHVALVLEDNLDDATCLKSPGALITPDIVVLRPPQCNNVPRAELRNDSTRIVGIEVKKLERTPGGAVARGSGMDYNTTPPCGTVIVYDSTGQLLPIRGFYLFVCLEGSENSRRVTSLLLVDGNVLNADFDFYRSIVGTRKKAIGLGTYGDGANRQRPMLIFANPLGNRQLDRTITLIHSSPDLEQTISGLKQVGTLRRTISNDESATFYVYRSERDVKTGERPVELVDPFPTPERTEDTSGRGRFQVSVTPRQ